MTMKYYHMYDVIYAFPITNQDQKEARNPTEDEYQSLDYSFITDEQEGEGPSHHSSFDNEPMVNESSSLVQVQLCF